MSGVTVVDDNLIEWPDEVEFYTTDPGPEPFGDPGNAVIVAYGLSKDQTKNLNLHGFIKEVKQVMQEPPLWRVVVKMYSPNPSISETGMPERGPTPPWSSN